MFNKFALLLLFSNLVLFVPSWGRIDQGEIFGFCSYIAILISSFFVASQKKIDTRAIGILAVIALVSYFFNFNDIVTRYGFLQYLAILLALIVLSKRLTLDEFDISTLASLYFLLTHIVLMAQYVEPKALHIFNTAEVSGFTQIPWALGTVTVLLLPFILRIHWSFILLAILPLYASKSVICCGIAALIFLIMMWQVHRKIAIALLLTGFFTTAGLLIKDFEIDRQPDHLTLNVAGHRFAVDSMRFEVWKRSAPYQENLWVGEGLGSWAHKGFVNRNGSTYYHWRWAHNEVYQYYFEQGIVGAVALLLWLGYLFKRSDLTCRLVLISLFLTSMVHPTFHYQRTAFLAFFLLAFVYSKTGTKDLATQNHH